MGLLNLFHQKHESQTEREARLRRQELMSAEIARAQLEERIEVLEKAASAKEISSEHCKGRRGSESSNGLLPG